MARNEPEHALEHHHGGSLPALSHHPRRDTSLLYPMKMPGWDSFRVRKVFQEVGYWHRVLVLWALIVKKLCLKHFSPSQFVPLEFLSEKFDSHQLESEVEALDLKFQVLDPQWKGPDPVSPSLWLDRRGEQQEFVTKLVYLLDLLNGALSNLIQ